MPANSLKVIGLVFLHLAAVSGLSGCEDDSLSLAPVEQDQAVLDAMEATILDEYRAELIYEKVLENFGEVRPFVNIVRAEVRHSESLARLFTSRGIPVPENPWSFDQIPAFSTLTQACQAGVVAEIENAEIYDRYFDLPLPADVMTVFENNRRASIENHLPAFQRCS
jgi:hypothetical protein